MAWKLDNDRPLYLQLMERIQQDIVSGVYTCDNRLPSVRELALEAAVNPNTMQKAFSELERSGLVYSKRTSGRFITEDTQMLKDLKAQLAQQHVQEFIKRMTSLGISREEILRLIQSATKEV